MFELFENYLLCLAAIPDFLIPQLVVMANLESIKGLVKILFWVIRAGIGIGGVVVPLYKLGNANANDDERGRDKALSAIIFTVVILVATFFIEDWVYDSMFTTIGTDSPA